MNYYFVLHGGEKKKQNILEIIACKNITAEDCIAKIRMNSDFVPTALMSSEWYTDYQILAKKTLTHSLNPNMSRLSFSG